MARGRPGKRAGAKATEAKVYEHKEAKVLLRPEVGTQAQFRKKKPPQKYRYDDSYLNYMRDRLKLARELLADSGSIFIQISDENLHHVRELLDEVFEGKNFCGLITFQKTGGAAPRLLSPIADYLLWYAKNKELVKYRQLFLPRELGLPGSELYQYVELLGGKTRRLTPEEVAKPSLLPKGARVYQTVSLQSPGASASDTEPFVFNGKKYRPNPNRHWATHVDGRKRLVAERRVIDSGEDSVRFKMFLDDYPVLPISNIWDDTQQGGFNDPKVYVVQTANKVIQRCLLMTTEPGDLVLDPTCGSGTTAVMAEQWGRRWITIDTSRVPLALARQRLLTATFHWYQLSDDARGPVAGFVYKPERETRNPAGIGPGVVPHITMGSIANNEPPKEEVLVDRPEMDVQVTRVTGPFVVEATIPTPIDWEGDGQEDSGIGAVAESYGTFVDRMLEVLRKSPVIQVGGGKTVEFKSVRQPAKTLSLSAEAVVANGKEIPVLPDLIDDSRFTVRWKGAECHLGSTVLFRLFRRLARPANHYVPVELLLEDVWGDERLEGTTIRSAVRNLRRKLEAAGMADLAEAIQVQPGHYALMLDGGAP